MEKSVRIEVSKTENGYSASCELMPGWVVAVTGTFDDLEREVKESIEFYVECAEMDGDTYPEIFKEEYTLQYKFDVQSLLCFYQSIFSFSALETITGINQKQLSHYAAGRSTPRIAQENKIRNGFQKLAAELNRVSI